MRPWAIVASATAVFSLSFGGGPTLALAEGKADRPPFTVVLDAQPLSEPWYSQTSFGGVLKGEKVVEGCHMPSAQRYVEDNFLSEEERKILLNMVERGMTGRSTEGGPTILDINSGYCKDSDGLVNIYEGKNKVTFSELEYATYRGMFERIRLRIMKVNGLKELYFTAPTFVARIIGSENWTPKEAHDEYWHAHVDKENTFHYDYSGLVYLSTYEEDFEGGEFLFLGRDENMAIMPRSGRFITFASGRENPHRLLQVTKGVRYVFSMWFTCDKTKVFRTFLDGESHQTLLSAKDEL